MDKDKKKKVLIGAGVGSFIIVTLFAFLIFNHDKSSNTSGTPEIIENTTIIKEEDKIDINSNEINEEKGTETQQTQDQLPFKEVVYNGNKILLESSDYSISSDGKLMFSNGFLDKKLQLPVSWENETIYIGEQPVEGTNEVATYISDMDYLRTYTDVEGKKFDKDSQIVMDQWPDNRPFSIAGTQFQKGIGFYLDYPWGSGRLSPLSLFTEYNLGGKYKTFKAEIGVDDEFKSGVSTFIVRVLGDNKLLYETPSFKGGDFSLPIEVDVTSVIRLAIEVDKQDDEAGKSEEFAKIIIGNPIVQ